MKGFTKGFLLASEGETPQQSHQDKRKLSVIPPERETDKASLFVWLGRQINRLGLQDIVSAQHHSGDFMETRAEYVALRLRFLIIFYSVAIPLWIPVDYLLLPSAQFFAMMLPKLSMAVVLFLLGRVTLRPLTITQVHGVLALTFIASAMFYCACLSILGNTGNDLRLAGYTLMPLMIVSMLGIFPLTLDWSLTLIAMTAMSYLGLEASRGRLLTADSANMLWMILMLGGIALWAQASQLMMLLRLYRESTQDPLTGLINRRALMKRLASEIARLGERKQAFCLLMFDLDRFKRINDNYGHLVGDKVLKAAAKVLQKELRVQDIVARFGGEEFVLVLAACQGDEALAIAERIRLRCFETHVLAPNGDDIQLSTSVGVTQYELGEAIEVTLNRVDEALYKAKELGRNRVAYGLNKGP